MRCGDTGGRQPAVFSVALTFSLPVLNAEIRPLPSQEGDSFFMLVTASSVNRSSVHVSMHCNSPHINYIFVVLRPIEDP
jgi:hypothetical protein